MYLFSIPFYVITMCKSILIIALPELPEVDGRVAQSTVFEISLFHFILVHFVFAALAAVVVASHNRFATDDASREITATRSADGVVFAYRFLAVTAGTFDPFPRGFLWRVFGEDADSNIHVVLALFMGAHALQFDKCSRTLFVTLH
jgi:hypothetical protein